MSKQYDVCVLGATGAVGETMFQVLEQRNFPVRNLYPLASSRSAGKTVEFRGKHYRVLDVAEFDFHNGAASSRNVKMEFASEVRL